MPAESQAQQKLMAMALAYKRGKMPHASKKIKEVAKGMSEKQLHDFAKTKREGLPEKKAGEFPLKMLSTQLAGGLAGSMLSPQHPLLGLGLGTLAGMSVGIPWELHSLKRKSVKQHKDKNTSKEDREALEHYYPELKEKKAFEIGFVKRAMEYGYTEEQGAELYKQAVTKAEMYDMQASPAMNAITASNIGLPYNALKDVTSPHDVPSRLLNISLPSIAGAIGGSALGAGLSSLGDAGLGNTLIHTALGGTGGALLGGYLGAKNYNEKIRDLLEDDQRVWENDAGRLRLKASLL